MSAATQPVTVTEPGVYEMTSIDYHADPVPGRSLSSSGARRLMPPSCPAIFKWERDNPPESTLAFDLGNAAHDKLLGGGPEIVVIDAPDWRTKKAQEEAKLARARGAVPILPRDREQVDAMVASIRNHPFAGRLFEHGAPEASLFWRDDRTGIWRRARLDWLPDRPTGRRFVIPDLKTAKSANPDDFVKSAANYGHHSQAAWYIDAARALGIADDPAFVFVVVEKTPPHVVSVVQLDVTALRIGAALNRRAIDTYVECSRTDTWPGYVTDVALASLPRWYEMQHEEDM